MFSHLKAVWTFRYFWMSLVRMDLRLAVPPVRPGHRLVAAAPDRDDGVFCVVFSQIMDIRATGAYGYRPRGGVRGVPADRDGRLGVPPQLDRDGLPGAARRTRRTSARARCPTASTRCGRCWGPAIHFVISLAVVVVLVVAS